MSKPHIISIRLTEKEYEQFAEAAEKAHVSQSEFARRAIKAQLWNGPTWQSNTSANSYAHVASLSHPITQNYATHQAWVDFCKWD